MQKEQSDARILDAAITLVGEYGYKGTTTRRIAERAGVNEITIFRKFGSKQGLFENAVVYIQNLIMNEMQKARIESTGNFSRDLTSLVMSLMHILTEKRETVIAVMFEAKREPFAMDVGRSMISFIIGLIAGLIDRSPEYRKMSKSAVDFMASAVLSFAFTRIVVRERLLPEEYNEDNRQKDVEMFVGVIMDGMSALKGGSPASERGDSS